MSEPISCEPLRVAIMGAGRMARHHAQALTRLPERARLRAIVDPDEEARGSLAAQHPDAGSFATVDEALAAGPLSAVHVCTPPATHASLALQALNAGCHVYVEKPFATNVEEASEILDLAWARGLHCCAGHQLLFERPSRDAMRLLPALGDLVHVESYFSFRQVRTGRKGRPALPAVLQLLDILPHPVYLLLAFLEKAEPTGRTALRDLTVGRGGTVHALVDRNGLTASLVVTLSGRPVESTVRLVGSNGTVQADYVRGTVQRLVGPGTSAIDKALQPFRLARQLLAGTTRSLGTRVLRRQKSYPGLAEIFEAFYAAAGSGAPPPMSSESILETVRICDEIERALRTGEPAPGNGTLSSEEGRRVLVTGGTGFLGRRVVEALRSRRAVPRVVARREPPPWDSLPGVEYVTGDLAEGLASELLHGMEAIVHCAAETAGGWEAHERNSVQATERLLRTAAEAGVPRFLHVSSIAVLDGPAPLDERSRLIDDRASGPYVWGKAESERRASRLGPELGLEVRIIRPGAIVNWAFLDPPGRLGKRFGNLFVAVGSPREALGVIDVREAAESIAWVCAHFEQAPEALNLVDPDLPSKRQLVGRLKELNPGLRVVWLPRLLLRPLSWGAALLQKALRPGSPTLDIAGVFAIREYDLTLSRRLREQVREELADQAGKARELPIPTPAET